MTRFAMAADLRRCVGCQTCTAACKVANATPPGVQWRHVLDLELGVYPDVRRVFVPVGCQHCASPACLEVCPTGATYKRDDGIVLVDERRCIGCSYCAVACPYDARTKIDRPGRAYREGAMEIELARDRPGRMGTMTKCDFCVERIDAGRARGLVPGVDPGATPICVNACLASALVFGDADDPESPVSRLLRETESFRMHEELGTEPGFHYVWESR